MNQGMNMNFNFNKPNMPQNNARFSTKSYNINSEVKYSTINNSSYNNESSTPRFKSVNGRSFDNYENVRIENQRFIDQLKGKH